MKRNYIIACLIGLGIFFGTGHSAHAAVITPADTVYAVQIQQSSQTIGLGTEHQVVFSIQRLLNDMGDFNLKVDGVYGKNTEAVIKSFQSEFGLKVDGKVGPKTANMLINVAQKMLNANSNPAALSKKDTMVSSQKTAKTINTKPSAMEPSVSKKQASTVKIISVTDVQRRLSELNYIKPANITGINDNVFKATVKLFQSVNGLLVDGIPGRETLTKMFSDNAKVYAKPVAVKDSFLTELKQGKVKTDSNFFIGVKKSEDRVYVYHKENGSWILIKELVCDTGADKTPTVEGNFYSGLKGLKLSVNNGKNVVKYFTQIEGNYLFHSVIYDLNGNVVDGRLGENISHGCIRLSENDAKYIYENVSARTGIQIIA